MATRFTKTNLIETIETINAKLAESGSDYCYKYDHRCGYHAVDLLRFEAGNNGLRTTTTYKGKQGCWMVVHNVDCAEPPRKLAERLEDEYDFYLGREVQA